jgi:hypothetical protein
MDSLPANILLTELILVKNCLRVQVDKIPQAVDLIKESRSTSIILTRPSERNFLEG